MCKTMVPSRYSRFGQSGNCHSVRTSFTKISACNLEYMVDLPCYCCHKEIASKPKLD